MDNPTPKIKEFLLDLFFPKFCLGCQKEGTYLCDDCRALLDIAEFDYCLCETKPIRLACFDATQHKSLAQGKPQAKCDRCKEKELSGLYSALPYKDNQLTKNLIYQFKYQPYLKDLAKTLASILIEHFVLAKKNTDEIWENSILVPIPLDKKKLKTRGYNQSEELAKELSKILLIPVVSDILVKVKNTKPQMELTKTGREKNLQGAFAVKPAFASELRRSKVFLVDDVYTTGSTMQECAKVLKEAGAKQVWGIVLAREELHFTLP
ncbi:MAG: ComF family protein [Candidatus Staskawiczbacteria bacterium]|nr:ComF family protein [Candidatus Staskawiczbacteria bacterium]